MGRSRSGFTLLEVMIAMSVLAVVSLAVARTIIATDRADRETQQWTAAHRAAQEMMETLLSEDFASIAAMSDERDPEYPYANGIFEVLSVQPRSRGYVQIGDLGWEGKADNAYLITVGFPVREDRRRFRFDVELQTVRTPY